ncbi:MAG: YgjP-like metallopeptidase domain-containing protein [Malacoplasma sp.]
MLKINKIIVYKDKIIRYVIEYSISRKYVSIKLDKNQNILVKANILTSEKAIEEFLSKHLEKLNSIIETKKNSSLYNINKNKISLFGIEHIIYIEKSFKNETYKVYPKKIFLYLNDKSNCEKVIKRLLKKTAEEYIVPRAMELSGKLNLRIDNVSIKWLTSTWGICNSSAKSISYSSRLAVFDKAIIDYVIIHEICHLIEPNHSSKFWNLVERHCPNFKELKNRLKDF